MLLKQYKYISLRSSPVQINQCLLHNQQVSKLSRMAASIKEMDQSNWVCYKFGDNSYYYGEVGLLDPSGVVHSKDSAEIATDPKVKLVKHGFGVYIYDDPKGQCRYQGTWAKDQKNGKGILRMKDGSVYEGQFKDGFYHDQGLFKWPNNDTYDGRWKKGKFEGPGAFKRHDGLNLKGSFKNGYFIDGNNLRNPLMSDKQYEDLKKRRKQITKQYQKNEKIKSGYFERVTNSQLNKVSSLVEKSTKNNRVALITASQQSEVHLKQVIETLQQGSGSKVHIVDLRKNFTLEGQKKYNYIRQVEKLTQECIKGGGILLLSLDDSEEVPQFEQLFYPQVKELYTTTGFNSSIWSPRDLNKSEIKNKIIGDAAVSEKFNFAVWSKVKLNENLSSDLIRQKLQKRFESIMPYIKIDTVFIEKGSKGPENPPTS